MLLTVLITEVIIDYNLFRCSSFMIQQETLADNLSIVMKSISW